MVAVVAAVAGIADHCPRTKRSLVVDGDGGGHIVAGGSVVALHIAAVAGDPNHYLLIPHWHCY